MNGAMLPVDGELSWARSVYLVGRRELLTRIRGKVFVVGTIVTVALLGLYAVLQLTVFDNISSTSTYRLAFTAQTQALRAPVAAAGSSLGFKVRATEVSDVAAAEARVKDGTLDALVTGSPTHPQVVVRSQIDSVLRGALDSVVRQEALNAELSQAGLDPAAVQARALRAGIHLEVLQPIKPHAAELPIAGAVLAFFLYLFINIYGGLIAQGVVTEKASRVVEVLLSTLRPGQLLLGKVLGVGLTGLLQFLIIAGCGLAFTVPTHILALPGAAVGSVLGGVLWFVLGFLLYALLLATSASLVSRVEDVQATSIPVTMILVLAWLLAYVLFIPQISAATQGTVVPAGVENLGTIASLIPFFSPVLMPIRIAAGDVPLWQGVLAVALTVASIAGVTWLGARVYANSVLRFGARVRFRDALRRAG